MVNLNINSHRWKNVEDILLSGKYFLICECMCSTGGRSFSIIVLLI